MRKSIVLAGIFFLLGNFISEARLAEPLTVPDGLKGIEPHNPIIAEYYLEELVKDGAMTLQEAEATLAYMRFRYVRRQQDLKEVEGLSPEIRREVMKKKRQERENPLVEYARYCGLSLERARVLMNLLHDSDKGNKYFKKV